MTYADDAVFLGGRELMLLLLLAFGGALLVGNVAALVRPPQRQDAGEVERAPLARSVIMALLGGIAALWALASLVS
jgi:hypothetical protein